MLDAIGKRLDRQKSIELTSRPPSDQRFDLGDVPGDVCLLFGCFAVRVVGPSPHPIEEHLQRDIEIDNVLEPVVEPA